MKARSGYKLEREQEEKHRELTPEEIEAAQRFNADVAAEFVKGMERGLREIWIFYALLFGLVPLLGWATRD